MNVALITSIDEARPLLPHWRRLAAGRPLIGPEWLMTWWRHFGAPNESAGESLALICVSDDEGVPQLLAPWRVQKSALHRRKLGFLGAGVICSDYLTIVCDPATQTPAIEALADWLCPPDPAQPGEFEWDLLHLESMDAADSVNSQLIEALSERGALTHLQSVTNCWRLQLPGTWEEYLAILSKSHRKRVRRLERSYFESGRVSVHQATDEDSFEVGFQILTRLHARRWTSQGEAGVFANRAFVQFQRDAMQQLLAAGQLSLTWLELDGAPIAADYSLVGDGITYTYQSGMEPDAAEHEPGNLSLISLIRGAIDRGYSAVDFMRGDEPYKQHWRAEPRPMHDWRVMPKSWNSQLKHTLWQAATNAKSLLRAGRNAVLSD